MERMRFSTRVRFEFWGGRSRSQIKPVFCALSIHIVKFHLKFGQRSNGLSA